MSALRTSLDVALARAPAHPIPPMTDPMGQYWDQPSRFEIEIDETHAMMTRETFDKLRNYSHSQPTGVYPGKMWKWHCPVHCNEPRAWLKWFGESFIKDGREFCSSGARQILIV